MAKMARPRWLKQWNKVRNFTLLAENLKGLQKNLKAEGASQFREDILWIVEECYCLQKSPRKQRKTTTSSYVGEKGPLNQLEKTWRGGQSLFTPV